MASLPKIDDVRALAVRFDNNHLIVDLDDGRAICTPIAWYPRLRKATEVQRNNWVIDGAAWGIHWPDLDEDLSVAGMLRGTPAPNWQQPD